MHGIVGWPAVLIKRRFAEERPHRQDASRSKHRPAMGGDNGDMATRSELLSFSTPGGQSAGRDARLCGGIRSGQKNARCDRGGGRRCGVILLRKDRRHGSGAKRGRRIPPLRLERVLVLPVPECSASACRAPLPRGSRTALLAHLHPRYQARSAQPEARQGDRARGNRGEDRLYAPAHHSLRPGRHLRYRARQQGRQSPRRHLRDGSRKLRAARPLGGRAWPAAACVRRLVAPRL